MSTGTALPVETIQCFVGGYGKPWTVNLYAQDPSTGLQTEDDITGYTGVSMLIFNTSNKPATSYTPVNAPSVVSASPAVLAWQPSSADMALVANFATQFIVTMPTSQPQAYRGPAYTVSQY